MRINLTSAFILLQEPEDVLAASGHHSDIIFGYSYGLLRPDLRLYKGTGMNAAGYLRMMHYLAPIRVNAGTPGGVWRSQPEVFHECYVSQTSLSRMATQEVVDGGWTAW